MIWRIVWGISVPFFGTALGAACVLFLRGGLGQGLRRALTGFAAGVMTAASVWSLLLPAIESSSALGRWAFLPAAAGFWAGVLFLAFLNSFIPHFNGKTASYPHSLTHFRNNSLLILAVVLHNFPEGMAVGAAYAGVLAGGRVTMAEALVLALGIAIQNIPEGAIISLPLRAEGMRIGRAFRMGVLSGAVEPLGAVLVLLAAQALVPALPWFLSFAAGAMVSVVVGELVPEAADSAAPGRGALPFAAGFTVMMALDVAFS